VWRRKEPGGDSPRGKEGETVCIRLARDEVRGRRGSVPLTGKCKVYHIKNRGEEKTGLKKSCGANGKEGSTKEGNLRTKIRSIGSLAY